MALPNHCISNGRDCGVRGASTCSPSKDTSGKGEDLIRAEEKVSLEAANPSSCWASGAPKAGVFAGPPSPSDWDSQQHQALRAPELGSDPIRW